MFLFAASSLAPFAAATARQQSGGEPAGEQIQRSSAKKAAPGVVGCLDQQDGGFVLLDEQKREPIANLEAVGFSAENFAKYLGQKVLVRGTSLPEKSRPTIKVRSIQRVSDVCAPQQ